MQLSISFGVYHIVSVEISCEVNPDAVNNQNLFQLGEHDDTPHGRLRRSDQKPVVAAGVNARHGGGGIPSNFVRDEPLPAFECSQVIAISCIDRQHRLFQGENE